MEFSLKGRKKARILSKPDKDRSVHSKLKSIIGGFWRVSCSIASPRDVSGKSSAADYIFKTPFHQATNFSNAATVCLRCHVIFQTFKGALLTRFLAEKREAATTSAKGGEIVTVRWSSHRACVRRHFDRTRRGDGPLCPFRPQKSSYHGRATFLLAEIPVTNKETWHFIALILSNITNYMKFKYFYCLWSLLGCHLTSIPFNFILYHNNHEEVKYKKQYHRLIHITIVVSVFKETFLIV